MNDNKPMFLFESPWGVQAGYGLWADCIARSLYRSSRFDLKLISTPWGSCPKKHSAADFANDSETQALLSMVLNAPLTRQPEIYCKCSIPSECQSLGKFNIAMTAGIESTIPPGDWIEGMNRMDLGIVTSNHSKNVFAGVNFTKNYKDGRQEQVNLQKPCEVVFWGIDTKKFYKTDVKNAHVDKHLADIKEKFAFLFVGQWTSNNINADRKNIGNLVKTFIETFRGVEENKPCLILKTSGATLSKIDKYECIGKLKSIIESMGDHPDNPNIYILHGELTDEEMNALYNHEKVKVHISLNRGEGFGQPLLEASLSGKPILASNWSGPLDFLDSKLCKLLPGELKQIPSEAVNQYFIAESSWWEVNYPAAKEIMLNVFNHYDSYLPNALKLMEINKEKFSIEAMDKVFHAVLDKYVPSFAMAKSIILPKLKRISLPSLKMPTPVIETKP